MNKKKLDLLVAVQLTSEREMLHLSTREKKPTNSLSPIPLPPDYNN